VLILLARRARPIPDERSTASNIVHTHTHKLQVQYQHTHAFVPLASANKDLAQLLVAAEHLIRHPQPGQLVLDPESQAQGLGETAPILGLPTTKRRRGTTLLQKSYASIPALDLMCLVKDIPDPPALSYKDRLQDLINDWLFGDDLKCDGINIPLVHWRALYKPFRPDVWPKIKVKWGQWRVSNARF
jgi:hypothetical protein